MIIEEQIQDWTNLDVHQDFIWVKLLRIFFINILDCKEN